MNPTEAVRHDGMLLMYVNVDIFSSLSKIPSLSLVLAVCCEQQCVYVCL